LSLAHEKPMKPGDPAALTGRLFRDMAGALELLTVYLGERLGLYQALYADGPATSAELAARDGHHRAVHPGMARTTTAPEER
jgi:hypothetical protein